ncbi:hypothetical protein BU16DRAFT_585989 [Lophium mytilinum]|uniref:Uncharacterized protein n=1 Tax=Lophium mytilinum TaxID=390894 RepID=A0A6A6QCQ7_9PEZI|nr:hypothetical protein BU16DRAFT_585989 [Lophium mytilinum]
MGILKYRKFERDTILTAFVPHATSAATNASGTITLLAFPTSKTISSAVVATSRSIHAHISPQHPEAVQSAAFVPAPASTSITPTSSRVKPSIGGINHPSGNTPVAPIAVHTEPWLVPASSSAPAAAPPASTPSAIQSEPANPVQIDPAPVVSPSAGGGGGGNGGGDSVVAPAPVATTATPVQNVNAPSTAALIPNHQQGNTAAPIAPGTPASVAVAGNEATGSTSGYVAPASGVQHSTLAPGETAVPQPSSIPFGESGYTFLATVLPTGVPYSTSAGLPYSASVAVTGSSSTALGYAFSTALAPYPSAGNGTTTTSFSPFGTIGTLVTYSFSQHSGTKSSTGAATLVASTTRGVTESAKPTSTPNAARPRFHVRTSGVGIWAVMVGIIVGVVG